MMRSKAAADQPNVLGFFSKHFVPIQIWVSKDADRQHAIYSAFVLSISNQWFLMTAGHCIKNIEQALAKGYVIDRCNLIDSLGNEATDSHCLPFDWLAASPTSMCYDESYDYGLVWIDDLYRRALEANGVQPIDEEAWEKQPKDPDFYLVVGVPGDFSSVSGDRTEVMTSLHPVEAIQEIPEGFTRTEAPTFYGRIILDDVVTDIRGISGGPLFALKKSPAGLKYWLLALQSRWLPESRLIAAPLVRPMATFIKEFMDGKHRDLVA
jgi:hypothetical protein